MFFLQVNSDKSEGVPERENAKNNSAQSTPTTLERHYSWSSLY
jgi:hypothetical protein